MLSVSERRRRVRATPPETYARVWRKACLTCGRPKKAGYAIKLPIRPRHYTLATSLRNPLTFIKTAPHYRGQGGLGNQTLLPKPSIHEVHLRLLATVIRMACSSLAFPGTNGLSSSAALTLSSSLTNILALPVSGFMMTAISLSAKPPKSAFAASGNLRTSSLPFELKVSLSGASVLQAASATTTIDRTTRALILFLLLLAIC